MAVRASNGSGDDEGVNLDAVRAVEQWRVGVIERVSKTVIALYDEQRTNTGSGVLISSDGLVLTNYHVVLPIGGRGLAGLPGVGLFRFQVVGVDPGGDLALIRLLPEKLDGESPPFPYAELGDSDAVRVGEPVMAMGNPFALTEDYYPTVTQGIVSGVERYRGSEGGSNMLVYGNCIQIDTSINPGNSGGPLFDLQGGLIGINGRCAFEERGRVNVGIGFAISARQITNFLPELEKGGVVHHGTLNATFRDHEKEVICDAIENDSAVAKAGLKLVDRLIAFDGQTIRSANHFTNLISMLPAGRAVQIAWEHDGQRHAAVVRLDALPYGPRAESEAEKLLPAQPGASPATQQAAPLAKALSLGVSKLNRSNLFAEALNRAQRCTVKLIGSGIAREHGYASGIVVSGDGLILTSFGVYLDGNDLRVVLPDGSVHQARLIRRSAVAPIALLKVEAATPDYFDVPERCDANPGDWVLAVGNSFHIAQGEEKLSATLGVLSFRGGLDVKKKTRESSNLHEALLIDPVVSNPGMPGGAVVGGDGGLVGMVGKILESAGTGTRINYAVPSDVLYRFLHKLEDAVVVPATQPVGSQPTVDLGIRIFGLAGKHGPAYIDRVITGSPAEGAGLRRDDLIIAVNGKTVRSIGEYSSAVQALQQNNPVTMQIKRKSQILTVILSPGGTRTDEPRQ